MLTRLLRWSWGQWRHGQCAGTDTAVDTPMVRGQVHGSKDRALWTAQTPIARYAEPEEVASAVCYLASEEAGFINGHILNVDGRAEVSEWFAVSGCDAPIIPEACKTHV